MLVQYHVTFKRDMPKSVLTSRKDLGMAYYYPEAAHTFSEYLLVPGYSGSEHTP